MAASLVALDLLVCSSSSASGKLCRAAVTPLGGPDSRASTRTAGLRGTKLRGAGPSANTRDGRWKRDVRELKWLALRGGGDDLPYEEPVPGKDVEGWSHFREDSILDYSIRDPYEDSHVSLDLGDGAWDPALTDPTTLPFDIARERLDKPQNFSIWMQESLAANEDYDIPPDPPFKGEAWVEELERVFDRLQEEWEAKQMDGSTAQADGSYHPRSGPYHRNPALDLTTSGTQERSWDPSRLSHFARQRALELAQANNATVWDEQADEDDAEQEELAPTPISTVQVDGQSKLMGEGQKFEPQYAAFRHFGEEDWGYSLACNTSMDANIDPWFKVNQDTNTSQDPFEGDWVDKTLEEHFQKQLAKFNANCREYYIQKSNTSYAGRMNSAAEEDDKLLYDCLDHAASVTYKNRMRTCPYASNKWVNNIGSMPKLEWNPETPLHQTSLWASKPPSMSSFQGPAQLHGIDGAPNDGADTGGWRNLGGDHLLQGSPDSEYEPSEPADYN